MCAEGWEGYQGKDLQCPSSQGMIGVSFFPSSFSQMGYWGFYHHLYMHHSDMVWEQVNQIGSVTESIEAVKMSKRAGWGVTASHCRFEVDLEYCRHGVI